MMIWSVQLTVNMRANDFYAINMLARVVNQKTSMLLPFNTELVSGMIQQISSAFVAQKEYIRARAQAKI